MIIERLTLHNYGVFLGRHEIPLAPESGERPVILIGGLNGAGKTSILESIRLALYGDRAELTKRGRQNYEDFLRSMVSHRAESREAGVQLRFVTREEGADRTYEVKRSWSVDERGGVTESVSIERDGLVDTALSAHWVEEVERFIPRSIAKLFLFDGEQIEELADPETSAEVLKTALDGLLGLEIIDRLSEDLLVLERRKKTSNATPMQAGELKRAEERLTEANALLERTTMAKASCLSALDRAREVHLAIRARFRSEGGDVYSAREQLVARRAELEGRREEAEQALKVSLAGPACLALVEDQLRVALSQAERGLADEESSRLVDALAGRDRAAIGHLRSTGARSDVVLELEKWLDADRRSRVPANTALDDGMDARQASELRTLLETGIPQNVARVREDAERLQQLSEELASLEREIDLIPSGERLRDLIEELERSSIDVGRLEGQVTELEAAVESAGRDAERAELQYASAYASVREADFAIQDDARVVTHASRARSTLRQLKALSRQRRVAEIETAVVECLGSLLRKERLIGRVRIDPDDCTLALFGLDDTPLRANQLSAGERQILATALLWALARVSGRPLPIVIDTPLGRLDGTHRDLIVERYLPVASHQVIVLVTDEETKPRHMAFLADHASRALALRFDDERQSTTVAEVAALEGVA